MADTKLVSRHGYRKCWKQIRLTLISYICIGSKFHVFLKLKVNTIVFAMKLTIFWLINSVSVSINRLTQPTALLITFRLCIPTNNLIFWDKTRISLFFKQHNSCPKHAALENESYDFGDMSGVLRYHMDAWENVENAVLFWRIMEVFTIICL